MRIAIAGKICSGKSFLAKLIATETNANIYSFGKPVKKYARELFNMKYKDRKLLQLFGEKMKDIDENIWIKQTFKEIDRDLFLKKQLNIVIDDLRFQNEAKYLQNKDFTIIKLTIDRKLQIERIYKTYPNKASEHINNLKHQSEQYIDSLPFDYEFNISKEMDNLQVFEYLKKKVVF
jgi:cytidylate kinase